MTEVRELLQSIASNTIGVLGVIISDKEGVPIIKAVIESNNPIVDGCFRHQFLSVFPSISEHATKMCLGSTKCIIGTFEDYQLIHCNHSPLVLTVVATNEAVTGQIMKMSESLTGLISDIGKTVGA